MRPVNVPTYRARVGETRVARKGVVGLAVVPYKKPYNGVGEPVIPAMLKYIVIDVERGAVAT